MDPLKLELLEVSSLRCRCCELNSGPLEEHYVLLTTWPLLWPPSIFLFWLVDGLEVFLFVLYLNLGLIAKNDSEGDPEMTVRLALFPKCWDVKCASPHPVMCF